MRIIGVLFIAAFFASCASDFGKVLKSTDYDYKLKKANEYFDKKKYKNAEQLYVELFPVYKGTEKFEELYYKYAFCSYYQKNYADAENLFKGFLDVFPNSSKAEEIAYLHAYTFYLQSPKIELEQVNTAKAIGMMQTFINTHPGSARNKEASQIIDICRAKLETKDFRSAQLYYDMGQYRAAGVAFAALLNSFPESLRGDEYKLMIIKSYYRYAEFSIEDKKPERYEHVIDECQDFVDRFPDSKLRKDAEDFLNLSQSQIKKLSNEQAKTPA